jgi:hypothetical protein
VLLGGEIIEQDVVLRANSGHPPDFIHIIRVSDVVPKNISRPRRGSSQPRQNIEEGSFSGAVVSQNCRDLPFVYRQIDSVDGLDFGLATVL